MIRRFFRWGKSLTALGAGAARIMLGRGWRYCVCCDRRVPAFLPWRGGMAAAPPLMRALDMIGSDLDHFACPRCGSTDRERHLRLYLEATGLAKEIVGRRVLHFAPEVRLAPWIASLMPSEHVLADLYPCADNIRCVDLEAIPFPDSYFDVVIANHVLEHVNDLDRAVAEIARVLKDGGWALLQVPWCSMLSTTIEDPAVSSATARLHLYGQEDHVRLFGADVFTQLGRHGLFGKPVLHFEVLASTSPAHVGVNEREPLMRFYRTPRIG